MARRPWTEEDYVERGIARMNLRIPLATKETLIAMAENEGVSAGALLTELVKEAARRRARTVR